MSHLSIDRLASLADDQPTDDERSHLVRCADCRREMEAHRSLLALAGGERESLGVPLTRWEMLSDHLRAEGLIVGRGRSGAADGSRFSLRNPRTLLQIAAALLLIAGGTVMGRLSAGASPVPGGITGTEPSQTAIRPDSLPTTFASVAEANRWKTFYANAYQSTVSFLAANDSVNRPAQSPAVMKTRLSALDRVSRTMQEALTDAPYDPVINDFYLNSFGQREATLRQLNTVLPQGVRMRSF
jgi:hypothetical protein